jgi:hypothetical protein
MGNQQYKPDSRPTRVSSFLHHHPVRLLTLVRAWARRHLPRPRAGVAQSLWLLAPSDIIPGVTCYGLQSWPPLVARAAERLLHALWLVFFLCEAACDALTPTDTDATAISDDAWSDIWFPNHSQLDDKFYNLESHGSWTVRPSRALQCHYYSFDSIRVRVGYIGYVHRDW